MVLQSNPSIGENSIEDEISKSNSSSLEEIVFTDKIKKGAVDIDRLS